MYSPDNLKELYKKIAFHYGGVQQLYGCSYIKSPGAWPDLVYDLNPSVSGTHELLRTIKSDLESQYPRIVMCDSNSTSLEIRYLFRKQATSSSFWTAMTLPLTSSALPSENPLIIKEIATTVELYEWCNLVALTLMNKKALDIDLFGCLLSDPDFKFLSGFKDNQCIATSLLFINGKEAGLYLISTDPSCRNKGYGSCIIRHAIMEAYKSGCNAISLQATSAGLRMYERIGFQVSHSIEVFHL